MDKERFLASGLIEQYVLGLTTSEETLEVERYARAFPEIQEEIDTLRRAMEEYAAQYTISYSKNLEDKDLSKTAHLQKTSSSSKENANTGTRVFQRMRFQFAAILFLALGMVAWLLWRQSQLQAEYRQLSSEFATLRSECESLQQEYKTSQQVVAFMNGIETRVLHLKGTSFNPAAHAVVYWNEQIKNAYISIKDMPPLPPGKQYQIWADVEGKMINAGLLVTNAEDWQAIEVIENAESLNITIEPKGGSEAPTVAFLIANCNLHSI
ncbi:MAG: anti-sigma factor [Saprospiraceae bacterium]|nr:anti-sigma factor [Saprospiraceae bacterium]